MLLFLTLLCSHLEILDLHSGGQQDLQPEKFLVIVGRAVQSRDSGTTAPVSFQWIPEW
jgi:hypothetical protein